MYLWLAVAQVLFSNMKFEFNHLQIQDALNYLKDASEQLEAVEHAGGSLEPRKAASQKPAEIRKCFEELVTCLRRAESVLVLPQPTTALEIYNAEQKVWHGWAEFLGDVDTVRGT